jgi:hypothetical protein
MVSLARPCSAMPSSSRSTTGFDVALRMSLDIVGSRSTASTSSKRVMTNPQSSSDQWTGSSSRSAA